MQTEANRKAVAKRKTARRIVQLLLVIAAVLIVSVLFLLPVLLSSEAGRKVILARINKSIPGRTDFADLSIGWSRGVRVTDFSFNDRADQASVQVKRITTKPHYASLLVGNLSFGQTVLDEPRVAINLKGGPSGQTEGAVSPRRKPPAIALPLATMDLVVKDGNFKVTDQQDRTVELSRINSQVSLKPPAQSTRFSIDMAVVGQDRESEIKAAGQVRSESAKKGWTLKGTTGDLTIEVNDLDLESLGPIFELANVGLQAKGLVSADVNAVVKDGSVENLSGSITATSLDITGPQLKGDRLTTGLLDVVVKLKGEPGLVDIETFQVDADWLDAKAGGVVPTTFRSWADFLTSNSDYTLNADFELDVDQVLTQMPRTFGIKEGMKVTSGKLSGTVTARRGKLTGQASLIELAGVVDGNKLVLSEPVTGEVEISAEKEIINFDKLDISGPFATIKASGPLEQLRHDGRIDLAKLQSELGQFANLGEYRLAGELSERGTLSIGKDKITGAGSAQIKDLRISSTEDVSAQEPMADIIFTFAVDRQNEILTIDSAQAKASLGQVSIKDGVVPLSDKAGKPMKLAVSASNVDLQKVQPFAVLFASLPPEMQLAGTAESQVQVTSQEGTYRIATDATKISNFKLVSAGKKPFEQKEVSLVFDAEVNPQEKTINVRKLQLESPQVKIKKGEFEKTDKDGKTKFQARIDCEYDWSAITAVASAFLPPGFEVAGQRQSAISFSSEYPAGQADQLLPNLDAKTKFGFEKAHYLGLNFGPTEVDVQIEDGLLNIPPFSATVNDGQLNFAGQADFKQKPTVLKTPGPIRVAKNVQINKETTEKLLMYVNPIFANAVNVSGVANFDCERLAIPLAGAAKKDIEVVGTLSVGNLQLQASDLLGQILSVAGTGLRGQKLTIQPTKFVLKDGFLRYDDMQVDVGDNPVNFQGTIGLDESLDMTVTLPYTLEGRTVRTGEAAASQRIALPLTGTIRKPRLDLAKLLQSQLKKQLEEQLRKGLEELFK